MPKVNGKTTMALINQKGGHTGPNKGQVGPNSAPPATTGGLISRAQSASIIPVGQVPGPNVKRQPVTDATQKPNGQSGAIVLPTAKQAPAPALHSTVAPFVAPKPTALAPTFANIPAELKAIPNWIVWRYMPPTSGTNWRKIPFQVNGNAASTTDPTAWTTFEAVCAKYEAGGYAGIGFVFDGAIGEDGLCYVGIDYDGCIADNVLQEPARSWVKQLATYAELSVSGTGIHCIARAKPLQAVTYKSADGKGNVEIYCDKRYFTVTGKTLGFNQIKAIPEAVGTFTDEVRARAGKQTASAPAASKTNLINLANFKNGMAAAFRGHETDESLADGLGADVEETRSAAAAIPASAISTEGDWMNLARALAHEAAIRNPEQADQLWEILDEISQRAPGYNKEDNHDRWLRYMNEAGDHSTPRTIATVFDLARKHEWQGRDLPATTANAATDTVNQAPGAATEIIFGEAYDFPEEQSLPMWDFIYIPHLLRGEASGTAAAGGIGKSTMSIAEALAMSSGRSLLAAHVPYPMRVLIINLEDNRNTMNKRIAAAMRHYRLTPADIGGRLFVIAKGELKLKVGPKAAAANTKKLSDALIRYIKEKKIDVVSIDPFVRVHNEEENNTTAIQNVVEQFEDIALQCNCAISLWHHTRKSNGGEVTVDSSRGASSFVDACRSVRILEHMSAQEAKNMHVENRRQYFKSFNGKLNYAPTPEKCDWFEIANVPLLNGGSLRPGDHVGVVINWQIPVIATLTPDQISKIYSALADGNGRESAQAAMLAGNLIAPVLGLDQDEDKEQLKQTLRILIKNGTLKRVTRPDEKRMPRPYIVPINWSAPGTDIEESTTARPNRKS